MEKTQGTIQVAFFILTIFLFHLSSLAEDTGLANQEPLWEYGFGIGTVQFEQYPASDQTSQITLPFPTFQYRGEILRADDREGAHAFLLKGDQWYFEIAGGILPALNSSDNRIRQGMDSIPWMSKVGPQFVRRLSESVKFKLATFQAIATDFKMTRFNGETLEAKVEYELQTPKFEKGDPAIVAFSQFYLGLKAGSRQFLSTYFSVAEEFRRPDRDPYDANAGLLSTEYSYFQSLSSGRLSVYFGTSMNDYSISANRESPLHRKNQTWNYFAGLTYTLGESERPSIPEEKTRGMIQGGSKVWLKPQ